MRHLSARSLLLPLGLALTLGCGGGSNGQPGLILSKSVFGTGSTPQPATMMLLRPPADPEGDWTVEEIVTEPGNLTVNSGTLADGTVVFRRMDGDQPMDEVVRLEPAGDGWAPVPAEGVASADVDWQMRDGKPSPKDYEMAGGNVFHKAIWWDPVYGEPGILTISANMPFLQIWRKSGGAWEPELLWTSVVGGREQRFRDIEIGDTDGDGQDELVIVTHDHGAVFVLEQTAEGMQATKLHEYDERIFVHEVELGDADGDGLPEIFTTPSEPNRFDGEHQAGWIAMYRYQDGSYERTLVDELDTRHAKEVLAYDYDGDGRVELYAALESEGLGQAGSGEGGVAVKTYRWDASGTMVPDQVIELGGTMCRFLCGGDTDGDGVREIVASTRDGGIYLVTKEDGAWSQKRIVPQYASGGFEHATTLIDFDGDGADEIFVANDDKKQVLKVRFDAESGRYKRDKIWDMGNSQYLAWNVMELPAGH